MRLSHKLFGLLTLTSLQMCSQTPVSETTADVLRRGAIVAHNIQEAMDLHIEHGDSINTRKQLPEDKRDPPPPLIQKNGDWDFDWTAGQQARYLMEEIRQGIHVIRTAQQARGMDAVALAGAQEYWPKLRDISCRENPGIRYYDLDGFEQYCPTK